MSTNYPPEVIRDLVRGVLPWEQTRQIMSAHKDPARFPVYREILQDSVPWDDPILLPIAEHLFIVRRGKRGVVKCTCGHEFCDFRQNWKLDANVIVRADSGSLEEIFGRGRPDPAYQEVREFVCPGCGTLLEVDVALVGSPITFDFRPDLVTFYRDWLDEPLPLDFEG